jgi:hypothetical protein
MSFSELRTELERIEREHNNEFESFRIAPNEEYDYGDDHPRQVFYVEGLRWETDEEYTTRMETSAKNEAAREQREREQLEYLLKKFGKNG